MSANLTLASPVSDVIDFVKNLVNMLPDGATIAVDLPLTSQSQIEVRLTKNTIIVIP